MKDVDEALFHMIPLCRICINRLEDILQKGYKVTGPPVTLGPIQMDITSSVKTLLSSSTGVYLLFSVLAFVTIHNNRRTVRYS
jgi:hypothetical protein